MVVTRRESSLVNSLLTKNIQYYTSYQILYVALVLILSSLGAFFHFLLSHEISIVEAWLHNNQWEILISSKVLSILLLNWWFRVKLYELKSLRSLALELVKWPEPKALVISLFMTASYLSLAKVTLTTQNFGYWYYHAISFLGMFLFFALEFVVLAYLDDILNIKEHSNRLFLGGVFTLLFAASYRLSVPDYYNLLPYVILCYVSLLALSGKTFKSWSNVVCFLLLFVAPMAALFGLDPVWGNDFSPFKVKQNLNLALLAIIWVISFGYYKYRDQLLILSRKLLR